MELRQLEMFVAVAEERHFTRAAARVHVVQSSLSAAVRALERELGEALFTRTNRQVSLTPAGRALLPAARRALTAAAEGRDAVAGVGGMLHGPLRVGTIQTLGVVDLPAALATFHRAHPEVTLHLQHGAAGDLARAVADAHLDVAFVDGPVDAARLTAIPLGTDRLVLVTAAGDPLATRTSIRLDDPAFAGRDFAAYRRDSALTAQILAACTAAGLACRVSSEISQMQYLVEFVRHGGGIAILPPGAVPAGTDGVRTVPVTPPLTRDIVAVVAAGRTPSAATAALLDITVPAGVTRR